MINLTESAAGKVKELLDQEGRFDQRAARFIVDKTAQRAIGIHGEEP